MGIYKYWHGDVEFAATYDYYPPEPAAGNINSTAEITDFEAISYRDIEKNIHMLVDPKIIEAFNSLEQIFYLDDDEYVRIREEEACNEYLDRLSE